MDELLFLHVQDNPKQRKKKDFMNDKIRTESEIIR